MLGFRELDRVLRGEAGQPGQEPRAGALLRVVVILAVSYGLCMSVYSLCSRDEPEYRQVLASAIKVPSLLLLTLFVTFPSLYVFNTLLGSRLRVDELARLLASAMGILIAVLAAFGPIIAFFSVTTSSYPFILLLNVAFFGMAGALGMGYLQRTLGKLIEIDNHRKSLLETPIVESDEDERSIARPVARPVRREESPARLVFSVWMAVFVLVGSQMSWVLRPFIGSPDKEFTWFRPRDSSFLEAVWRSLKHALAGA